MIKGQQKYGTTKQVQGGKDRRATILGIEAFANHLTNEKCVCLRRFRIERGIPIRKHSSEYKWESLGRHTSAIFGLKAGYSTYGTLLVKRVKTQYFLCRNFIIIIFICVSFTCIFFYYSYSTFIVFVNGENVFKIR